ncbi:MAG: tRNA (adenosine(37)-N6)-threonylcarbamoyltransferase complex dimerization subunit type 1 TsaB [Anaerorhabdus sp.]
MITLCMDTCQKYLVLVLIKDNEVIGKYSEVCLRKQSEFIFLRLIELCDSVNITAEDIDEIVITDGPGSYTGVRIAMTIAKVFCTQKSAKLYTLSSLLLYIGKNDGYSILDARADRAYIAKYIKGTIDGEINILKLSDIKNIVNKSEVYGDGSLIGLNDKYCDFAESFLSLKEKWNLVKDIHSLTPKYLKEQDSYLVK